MHVTWANETGHKRDAMIYQRYILPHVYFMSTNNQYISMISIFDLCIISLFFVYIYHVVLVLGR
jgi:hypothetical protein